MQHESIKQQIFFVCVCFLNLLFGVSLRKVHLPAELGMELAMLVDSPQVASAAVQGAEAASARRSQHGEGPGWYQG